MQFHIITRVSLLRMLSINAFVRLWPLFWKHQAGNKTEFILQIWEEDFCNQRCQTTTDTDKKATTAYRSTLSRIVKDGKAWIGTQSVMLTKMTSWKRSQKKKNFFLLLKLLLEETDPVLS